MSPFFWISIFAISLTLVSCQSKKDKSSHSILMLSPTTTSVLAGVDLQRRIPKPCNVNDPTIDPYFPFQWHLENTGQPLYKNAFPVGVPGQDIRVKPVWQSGNFGQNILVSVVDDGLDIDHEDLVDNITEGSRNFLTQNGFPSNHPGGIQASHGTSVAGIIAARAQNGLGLSGVAPCAHLIGNNFLLSSTTSNLMQALSSNHQVAISNNSWGSEDGTGLLFYPVQQWKDAITNGLREGRNQLGTVYVWAAGNGHHGSSTTNNLVDNSNYDGYSNFHGVIAVGAVTNQGVRANYSERGANLWISSYSGEHGSSGIATTDLIGDNWGYNPGGVSPNTAPSQNNFQNLNYTNSFNGTSAATPSVVGVIALMLKENPNLTYRDIKLILAHSARRIDPLSPDWSTNASGISFNPNYGFGVLDANAAVQLSKSWQSVGGFSNLKVHTTPQFGNVLIQPNTILTVNIPVTSSNIQSIEFTEITLSITYPDTGKLLIELESPHGTIPSRATLYEPHLCFAEKNRKGGTRLCNPIQGFSFGASQFLNEQADGVWKLIITNNHTDSGQLNSIQIRFYGR